MTPGVRPIVIGNWKMNGTREALPTIRDIAAGLEGATGGHADGVLCPPSTLLYVATTLVDGTPLAIGAQDCHEAQHGAHTGDISAEMLRDCEAECCIVGHSERRADHHESNDVVRKKADACIRAGLTAIVCIGETDEQNRAGRTQDVLSEQLEGSLPASAAASDVIVAYEPVWAIGTGRTPEPDEISATHAHLRSELRRLLGDEGATVRLLYGGSVKPSNAAAILGIANVDGALVGGASLKPTDFLGICAIYSELEQGVGTATTAV